MAAINADTADAWRCMAAQLSEQRPYPGRKVRIVGGRKHRGRVGVVTRHMVSRYEDPFRYGGDANLHMREMAGRYGFVCLVQPEDGAKPFWVKADYTECIDDTARQREVRS